MFRAWQAGPVRHTADGRPCNATRGFACWLSALLETSGNEPLACFFDAHDGRSQRRDLHPPYKADRPPVDPLLLCQIEDCRVLCRELGLPVITASDGLEADDLMAACSDQARAAQHAVTVVSGDKDLAQLIATEDDLWWDAGRREPLDAAGITKRFRVTPQQIPDWLALAGDASDNIAGVPGIGPPTAARLLKRWGDLDGVFGHLDEVAGMGFRGAPRVATLLAEHETRVREARTLTGPLAVPSVPDMAALTNSLPPAEPDALQSLGLDAATARRLHRQRMESAA